MLGLLWLLAAVKVLGTLYTLPTLVSFLKSVDSDLPLTVAADSKICYYFDVSQSCSAKAIGDILSQEPVANLAYWTPTTAQCDSLLSGQRLYAEKVANSVFSAAIASAATAGVIYFELLAQSWILRAGHHPLTSTHAAFVTAINSISDWATVHCDGDNLLYDSMTLPKPDFFKEKDCDVLDTLFDPPSCGDSTCPDAIYCCARETNTPCCLVHQVDFQPLCNYEDCFFSGFCCDISPGSPCCLAS